MLESTIGDEVVYQPGTLPSEAGLPEPAYAVFKADGMQIERDCPIALRDGVEILADVFRPLTGVDLPVLVAWSPYGKHNGIAMYQNFVDERGVRGGGVRPEWMSQYAGFEGPDPAQWCARGYAIVKVDPRGLWWSGGEAARLLCTAEAQDVHDVIEWAADQTWSSGRVGMTGASYLAMIQWWAAAEAPPHLAAINPWEGVTDPYREFFLHGGIPDSHFPRLWQTMRLKYSRTKVEAMADMTERHPLDDAYWESKRAELERIQVPAYVVASWSDQGLHTRGTLNGFEQISSPDKFLEVHGRKKWEHYHRPESVERQMQFFDRFLKGVDDATATWPRVRIELRSAFYEGEERELAAWPPSTRSMRIDLDAHAMTMEPARPDRSAGVSYDSEASDGELVFRHVFAQDTDVVGTAALKLWVSAESGGDMDLFVGLRKLDRDGRPVHFPFANVLEDGPVALGWLRVSHRGLDETVSTPERPRHLHTEELPLDPGEIVPVVIEIWPSGTRFAEGEVLELVVKGSDLYTVAILSRHAETRNHGRHTLHCGGEHDSHLLLPVLD